MGQQARTRFLPPPRSTKYCVADGAGLAASAVAAIGMDRDHARRRFGSVRAYRPRTARRNLWAGRLISDLVADHPAPPAAQIGPNHLKFILALAEPAIIRYMLAWQRRTCQRPTGAVGRPLDPGRVFVAKDCRPDILWEGINRDRVRLTRAAFRPATIWAWGDIRSAASASSLFAALVWRSPGSSPRRLFF